MLLGKLSSMLRAVPSFMPARYFFLVLFDRRFRQPQLPAGARL